MSRAYIYPGLPVLRKQIRRALITTELIVEASSSAYGIPANDLYRKTKEPTIAECRQICMHLFRFALGYSTTQAGMIFRKDHATVLYATKTVRKKLNKYEFRNRYDGICKKIGFV